MRLIPVDRRRAFGPWLLAAVVLYAALYAQNVLYELFETEGNALMLFEFSRSMGHTLWLMPLAAALPFGMGFCVDCKSGYLRPMVLRAGRKKYIGSKAAACFLSGGAAAAGGTLAFLLLAIWRYPPEDWAALAQFMDASSMQDVLVQGNYFLYFSGVIYLQFLAGGFWALTALAFSAYFPNALLSMCVPLLLYRLISEAGELFLPTWLNLPVLGDGMLLEGFWTSLAISTPVFLACASLCAGLFALGVTRRLHHA